MSAEISFQDLNQEPLPLQPVEQTVIYTSGNANHYRAVDYMQGRFLITAPTLESEVGQHIYPNKLPSNGKPEADPDNIDRAIKVLTLGAVGLSAMQTAERLYVSRSTVVNNRLRFNQALGTSSFNNTITAAFSEERKLFTAVHAAPYSYIDNSKVNDRRERIMYETLSGHDYSAIARQFGTGAVNIRVEAYKLFDAYNVANMAGMITLAHLMPVKPRKTPYRVGRQDGHQ
jgi:DNA-binding CsgD family transcriptional regulator